MQQTAPISLTGNSHTSTQGESDPLPTSLMSLTQTSLKTFSDSKVLLALIRFLSNSFTHSVLRNDLLKHLVLKEKLLTVLNFNC